MVIMSVKEARALLGDRAEWQLKKIRRDLNPGKQKGGLYSSPTSSQDAKLYEAASVLLKDIRQRRKYPDRYYPDKYVVVDEEMTAGEWRKKKGKKIDLSKFNNKNIFR